MNRDDFLLSTHAHAFNIKVNIFWADWTNSQLQSELIDSELII